MTCEEVKISLHDFIDETLDGYSKRFIETHIRECSKCFTQYKKIRLLFESLGKLPGTIEAPHDIIEILSSELLNRSAKDEEHKEILSPSDQKKIKKEKAKLEKKLKTIRSVVHKSEVSKKLNIPVSRAISSTRNINWLKTFLTLLPLLMIGAGYFIYDYQKYNHPWGVKALEGTPLINGRADSNYKLDQGESLLTDEKSRAVVEVPKVGNVEVGYSTLLFLEKGKDGNNKISLKNGSIKIVNSADLPDLAIIMKNSEVIDRSGEFALKVDENENGKLNVNYGFVEIKYMKESFLINEAHVCEIRNGFRPGTPYRIDASDTLKKAVQLFDFNNGGEKAVETIISAAKETDVLTLLALIPYVSQLQRQILFQEISNHFPPPEDVTRMGIIKLNLDMLYRWWEEIEWQL